jgi:hypothetical protein
MKSYSCKITKQYHQTDQYQNSGIYQLRCTDCNKKYGGQTEHTFNVKYNDTLRQLDLISNSKFAQPILDSGPMQDTMNIVQTMKKGQYMNALERCHV